MSFKIPIEFVCDAEGCERTAQITTIVDTEEYVEHDSYGNRTSRTYLYPRDIPKNWKSRCFFGTLSHYCERHHRT